MELCNILRKAREAKNWSLKKLSEVSGIHANTIRNYEAEKAEPAFFNLCCLAKALELDMNYLAGICDPGQEKLQDYIFELNEENAKLRRELKRRTQAEEKAVKILQQMKRGGRK